LAPVTASSNPLTLTRSGIIGTVLVLMVAAVCVRLAIWQLDRLGQRRERNAALEARPDGPPGTLTRPPGHPAGLPHPRPPPPGSGAVDDEPTIVLPARSYRGSPGVHVLTPLRLGGSGPGILVNRGWVPAADGATVPLDSLRTASADTTVEGILLPFPGRSESRGAAGAPPADSVFRRVWYTLDEEQLRGQLPYALADVELQPLPAERPAARLPVPLPPPALDEGPHRGYAIQWFSFAASAIVGWIALLNRERRQQRTTRRSD